VIRQEFNESEKKKESQFVDLIPFFFSELLREVKTEDDEIFKRYKTL
jgi:hypothetical protein